MWKEIALGICLAVASVAAAAQARLEPSAALRCLKPGPNDRARFEYPPALLQRKEAGIVEVSMEFTAPDQPPAVRVLNETKATAGLVEAVREHVARFRVPCLKSSVASVVLRQSYMFTPNEGRKVAQSEVREAPSEALTRREHCLAQMPGSLLGLHTPVEAPRDGDEGRFYVRMRFDSADSPPDVTVLAGTQTARGLRRHLMNYLEEMRLSCVQQGEPIELTRLYAFKPEEGERTVRDADLLGLLRRARSIEPAYFELQRMGCPFDVRFTYYRPYRPNDVEELDTHNPARLPFLDWLSRLTLEMPEKANTELLGDSTTLRVPCHTLSM